MRKNNRNMASALKTQLETRIASGEYQPGEKLPPLRELALNFGVSNYVVHNCFQALQSRGLLELRRGSGAYVAEPARRAAAHTGWNITVFANSTLKGSGYLMQSLVGIQHRAIQRDCPVTLRKRDYYEFYEPEPPLENQVKGADGLIFLGQYDYRPLALPAGLPAVGLEMQDTCGQALSILSIDPQESARLAVDFFRRRGIETVRIFLMEKAELHRFRAECFRLLWRRHGSCELEEHPLDVEAPGIVRAGDDRSCGLLFTGGSYCQKCIEDYYRASGRAMDRDFTVLSIDGKSLAVPFYTPVSTVAIDWQAAGEAAFDELVRRLESPGATGRRIFLLPELHEI